MTRKMVLLLVCLVVVGLPIAAHASSRVIFVLVDAKANRAYAPEETLYANNYYNWSFIVTGDYSDSDGRISPYVGISSADNNYNCYHPIIYNESGPTCTASAYTQFTGNCCVNTVYTYALLYKIEYTNDPYHDNYYGFNFEVDWGTAFY